MPNQVPIDEVGDTGNRRCAMTQASSGYRVFTVGTHGVAALVWLVMWATAGYLGLGMLLIGLTLLALHLAATFVIGDRWWLLSLAPLVLLAILFLFFTTSFCADCAESEITLYDWVLWGLLLLGAVTFVVTIATEASIALGRWRRSKFR
jgi:hypothetical protein